MTPDPQPLDLEEIRQRVENAAFHRYRSDWDGITAALIAEVERLRAEVGSTAADRFEETSMRLDVALNQDRRDAGIRGCRRCGGRVYCSCPEGALL